MIQIIICLLNSIPYFYNKFLINHHSLRKYLDRLKFPRLFPFFHNITSYFIMAKFSTFPIGLLFLPQLIYNPYLLLQSSFQTLLRISENRVNTRHARYTFPISLQTRYSRISREIGQEQTNSTANRPSSTNISYTGNFLDRWQAILSRNKLDDSSHSIATCNNNSRLDKLTQHPRNLASLAFPT